MTIPTASGIYRITCTATGKIYIGSAINLCERWREHRHRFHQNDHPNKKLQNAWYKYGPDAFIFEVIELVLPMSLTAREQYWMNKLHPTFNIAPIAGSSLGTKHTPEARAKIKAARAIQPSPNLGRKLSLGQIEQMRLRRLGQKANDETRAKMSKSQKGRKHSEDTKEKIGLANTKTYIVTAPDGTECLIHGIYKFCEDHSLDAPSLINVARGKRHHHKGWKARHP